MNTRNIYIKSFLFIFIILIFLKVDYRLISEISCCGDDFDYYAHAETIAIDFDLDYTNQLEGFEKERFFKNNKIAPIGFIGTGIFSAPFLLIGSQIDNFLNIESNNVMNFKILLYSIAPIFYFLMTVNLLQKILNLLQIKYNINEIFIIFFGSGITYYAFERYSMTHIYEAFCATLIFFVSLKFYLSKNTNKYFAIALPLVFVISFSVRWVNYFYFLIPIMSYKMLSISKDEIPKLKNNKYFLFSSISSIFLFLKLSNLIYGKYTIDPRYVYLNTDKLENYFLSSGIKDFVIENLFNFLKIFFTQEFGLFWFSPILFLGFLYSFYQTIIKIKNERFSYDFIYLLSFLQLIGIVLIWKSTGSSYGFRYLFSITPLFIIYYFHTINAKKNKILRYYLLYFSFFSSVSILFFETTPGTQLSTSYINNSFGYLDIYTQPNYLINLFKSFLEITSYLKILTTSFLGLLVFKLIFYFFEKIELINFLTYFGLPTENKDFISYLDIVEKLEMSKIIFLSVFLLLVTINYKKIYLRNFK